MGRRIWLKRPQVGLPDAAQPQGIDIGMDEKPSTRDLIAALCDFGGRVSLCELERHPSGYFPEHVEPVTIAAAGSDDGNRLNVCPGDVRTAFSDYLASEPAVHRPFLLVCRRRLETMNSAFTNAERLKSRFPLQMICMHPDDISLAGLADGDVVDIEADSGRMTGALHADTTLKQGVISAFHMSSTCESEKRGLGAANRLVSLTSKLEPINFMPRQSSIPVTVRRSACSNAHGQH